MIELPHSNAVGLAVIPPGYQRAARTASPGVRLLAAALLLCFFFVVSVTTALSLGAYCLTSDAMNTRDLPLSRRGP